MHIWNHFSEISKKHRNILLLLSKDSLGITYWTIDLDKWTNSYGQLWWTSLNSFFTLQDKAFKTTWEHFWLQTKSMKESRMDGLERWKDFLKRRGIKGLRKDGVNSGSEAGWKVLDQYNLIVPLNPVMSWQDLSVLHTPASPLWASIHLVQNWSSSAGLDVIIHFKRIVEMMWIKWLLWTSFTGACESARWQVLKISSS